jgi:hypothetical protein
MVSPYLLRPRRSLEEVAADRTSWTLLHKAHIEERWLALTERRRAATAAGQRGEPLPLPAEEALARQS